MKISLGIIVIQVLLISCNQVATKEVVLADDKIILTEKSHDLLFYNVENLFDTSDDPNTYDEDFLPHSKKQWTNERLQDKIDKLGEVILAVNRKGPLLIGLVEIENSFVVDQLLASKRLKNIDYNYAHFESPDERGIDVALMYKAEYFTVKSKEPLTVNLNDNDKTRDILYVTGTISGESNLFHIFVNHWPSRGGGAEKSEPKRILAATVLRGKIDEIRGMNAEAKIIVMGDFNDYPNNQSIRETLNANNTISNGELFNLASQLDEDDKGSYNYRGDWGMLDQMMVSAAVLDEKVGMYSVKKEGFRIFNEDFVLFYDKKHKESKPSRTYGGDNYYGGYSDHLPVYIKLYRATK